MDISVSRVAMISGASRGIGAAIARELSARGWRLSLGLRDPARSPLPESETLFVHPYQAERDTDAPDWVAATLAQWGRVDALVNNAGISRFVGLEAGDPADLDQLYTVNVRAPFMLTRAALPALKASGRGRVVNVASLSGKRVLGLNAGYQMAKHAVVALTHATRRIGWEHGIRATALCPGYVATDMTAQVSDPSPDEMIDPADLARLVATTMELPNTASVAELLVNCRYETLL